MRICDRTNYIDIDVDTNHPEMKNKPLDFYEKKLESLKSSKNNIFNFATIIQKAAYASFKISLWIAQTGKFLILPAVKDVVNRRAMYDQRSRKVIAFK